MSVENSCVVSPQKNHQFRVCVKTKQTRENVTETLPLLWIHNHKQQKRRAALLRNHFFFSSKRMQSDDEIITTEVEIINYNGQTDSFYKDIKVEAASADAVEDSQFHNVSWLHINFSLNK